MKIVEDVSLLNEDKVWTGKKEIKLTFDTETEYLEVDIPAMFTNPKVRFEELKAVVEKLDKIGEEAKEGAKARLRSVPDDNEPIPGE